MTDNFDRAFQYALGNEGGYSNHKADSGGATKYGITLATLSRWRGTVCTPTEVQLLQRDEAKAIYKANYWDVIKGDQIGDLVIATVLFDAAILFGTHAVIKLAQEVFGVMTDGVIGKVTLAMLNRRDGQASFVLGLQGKLKDRVKAIVEEYPKNKVFQDGWINRLNRFTTLLPPDTLI